MEHAMEHLETAVGSKADNDASLLEGLYQLVISGHTDSWEFEQLTNEVYERLLDTYTRAA
jgi:hypothetical protein